MADPRAVVPYYDPYDNDDLLRIINDPNPSLMDLSLDDDGNSISQINNPPLPMDNTLPVDSSLPDDGNSLTIGGPSDFLELDDHISDVNHPFEDPILAWSLDEKTNGDAAGIPQVGDTESIFEGSSAHMVYMDSVDGRENSMAVVDWPPPVLPFTCSYCEVLREIVHSNGRESTRLELHGTIGFVSHALLEIQPNESSSLGIQYQLFDFSDKGIDEVHQFIVQYCIEKREARFDMVPDPLACFYKAICVGLDRDENTTNDDEFSSNTHSSANSATSAQMEQNEKPKEPEKKKSALATQRERTGKLTIDDIRDYFHLPIEEAARRMRLCPTVMKKICRRDGLNRWPHRRIKSIQRKISTWKVHLRSSNQEQRARAESEIGRLERTIEELRFGDLRV